MPSSTSPKRYRSPAGLRRPYRDGERWVAPAQVTMPDGRVKLVRGTGVTQDVALQRRDALIERAVEQARQPQRSELRSVTGWCQHWLDNIKGDSLRYRTRVGYRHAIDAWITPHLGKLPLHGVTLEGVEELHSAIKRAGLSRTIWAQVRTVLSQALTEAVKRGHLENHPMAYAPGVGPKTRSHAYLDESQARRVIATCDSASERARWLMALTLGLRQGEALALTWADIRLDDAAPVVSINKTLQRVSGVGLVTSPPKTTKSVRDLLLPPSLVEALRAHRHQQRSSFLGLGLPWSDQRPVFATPRGTHRDPTNDRRAWASVLARAGVAYVKPHAARHSAATLMLSAGVELSLVADALGHASVSITADIYGHLPREAVGHATAAVAARLTG